MLSSCLLYRKPHLGLSYLSISLFTYVVFDLLAIDLFTIVKSPLLHTFFIDTDRSELCKLEVTKLDGNNYAAWKFKVTMLLPHKGFWDAVNGSDDDVEKSKKALAIIDLSVKDSQIVYIQYCSTGKEAWDKLARLYENSGVANKMHLIEELMTAKMADEGK
eukprot:IDg14945t1